MGCSNSKSSGTKFTLTDVQKKTIRENAQSIVLTSAALRIGATNAALRFTGNRTATAIATDTTALRTYFQAEVPQELGDGSKSMTDVIAELKRITFDNITGKLGPQIEVDHPKVKTDVALQRSVRSAIEAESNAAAHTVILDMIDRCIQTASRQPDPKAVEPSAAGGAVVPQSRGATGAAGTAGATGSSPAANGRGPAGAKNRAGGADDGEIVLPKGDWEKAEGTPYYYSATENLYFHPPSSQFYDPSNGMWYDPDLDEWYQEDE